MATDFSQGALTKLSIGGTPMAVSSCTLGMREALLQRTGIRGTRAHFDTDARKGPQRIGGTINLEPSYAELIALGALAIGAGGNAAESVSEFTVVVDRKARIDTYAGCKVARMTVAGQQGGIVSCSLDIVGRTETTNSGSVSVPASAIPFIMSDLTLTLASSGREAQNFQLVIDNMIDADRFLNALTLSKVVELDRAVSLTTAVPWNDANIDLYNQAVAGAAGTLALNNGTNLATFSFGRLQLPAESVEIPGKQELMLTLNMIATKVNASAAGTTDDIALA
jgi:hypothetical protein